MREIVLPGKESAKKLENFLKKEFPIGYIRKLFRKNGVRVNGRRATAGDIVKGGDRIQLYIEFEKKGPAAKKSTSTAKCAGIIYEDDSLLVLNKPAGIAVHEGKSVRKQESLLGILENTYRNRHIQPQLVHRLDKNTSGLLLVAKTLETAQDLQTRFAEAEVTKEYVCLVIGRLIFDSGRIDFPLPGRDGYPVPAITHYQVLKRFSDTTLVKVQLETGRLHQIRLHFARLGYPVVMDEQHGDFGFNKQFRKRFGLKRQFLHARKLALKHAGKPREWLAPLPDELRHTLEQISQHTA